MASHTTYIGAFHESVQRWADSPALSFLPDGSVEEVVSWTFADLYRQASGVAARLKEAVTPGERVPLLAPPGLDYVAGFFGCLYAGVVAVPVYPPSPMQGPDGLERLHSVA